MEKKEHLTPVDVTESDGMILVTYDGLRVELPATGPVPDGTPDLARRIFEVYRRDLRPDNCAE